MKFSIKNLGSINHADIDLKPLTIFLGENGTGKTWAAYTIAGIFGPYGYEKHLHEYLEGMVEEYAFIEEAISGVIENGTAQIDLADHAHEWAELYFNRIASSAPNWLNDFMCSKHADFNNCEIKLNLCQKYKDDIVTALRRLDKRMELSIGTKKKDTSVTLNIMTENDSLDLFLYLTESDAIDSEKDNKKQIPKAVLHKEIRRFILSQLFRIIRDSLFGNAPVFPTERTTITTYPFHKKEESDSSGRKDKNAFISYPVRYFTRMIGAALHKFRDVEETKDRELEYVKLADLLEKKILLGSIDISKEEKKFEFSHTSHDDIQLELKASSSMVKELASLVLYLRYLASPGDLLIIDEPEMNLHPWAQLEIAEFIGLMINAGLKCLITTHSPYIVDHIGNLIQAKKTCKVKELEQEFALKNSKAFIDQENVSLYEFIDGTAKNILREDGVIEWDTFSDVSSELSRIYSKVLKYTEASQNSL